ncbi:MAG: plasmid stabilization protein [Candidatus Lambdaproteobacteria bacterium RIFOXYD1_FULL_56_27]|uniref:Plasmid stabilization protein n=1 Tax=Candidatus Lambdaproteobacteria bacterium RIFOXYD2_FULL_56_26 TaxID=1817773 RepID=A0A1F6GLF7_9PROT|nr:MAG: plasmid stabilization protein [Candidatus Lambdaproteobacteria bacterium RIFOXYD2_FULL_56_26]OGH05455.1 MAG: plasmid stabilization protein [Candidatus Lambdaproteobacteria bacterium RIFOXYC1_FULL_56_13]OGH09746.1 MAG: plasmid stabilization protein [Candidatus Lambdaproteobacteria bacterium RIFOXYD1_FULL_56_27]
MAFEVLLSKSVLKTLKKIPPPFQDRLVQAITDLETEARPSGAKKLVGREAWRIRVGDYRIIYEIEDEQLKIWVIDLGNRREIYRK